MDNLDKYDELLKLLTEEVIIDGKEYLLKDEFEKFFIKGNQSAGIRIRKIMQEIRGLVNQAALGGAGDPDSHADFEAILKVSRENYVIPNYTTSGFSLTDRSVAISKEYCGSVAVSEYRNEYNNIDERNDY
jgi:hypothetical protein